MGIGCKIAFVLGVILSLPGARANNVSFTGVFSQDDNVRLFGFMLNAPGTAVLKTWSYGGGVDAAGQLIPSGGFATDLALFSGSGSLIDFTTAGSCPPQNLDPVTGLCGDAVLSANLAPGNYVAALTEFFNIPNGLKLSNGFLEDGQGNFTGPALCGVTGGFYDVGCNKRTGNFELDLMGVTSAVAVPEPSYTLLMALLISGCTVLVRMRARS